MLLASKDAQHHSLFMKKKTKKKEDEEEEKKSFPLSNNITFLEFCQF